MKICIISPKFPLPEVSSYSGPDNVVFNFLQSVAQNHHELSINVVTILDGIKHQTSHKLFHNVNITYLPAIKILPRSLTDPYVIKKYLKNRKYDLVHAHYPIALLFILNIDTPTILTLHGIISKEKQFEKNPFVKILYHDYNNYMIRRILSKVNAFVAISPYVLSQLKNSGIYENINKIYQINNSVNFKLFNIKNELDSNLIFYPAVIRSLKNQHGALEVIELLKNKIDSFKFIFAGSCDKPYLDQMIDEIESNNLKDYVYYAGILNQQEMHEYYSKASIVLLLSYQETQPMAILEAMASGIPVIASNLESTSYIIDHGFDGYLVNPDDYETISKYITELLKDKKRRLLMGSRAKEKAIKYYNPHFIAETTIEMYKSLIK